MKRGMQFGKIGLKLDQMNLHALAERQSNDSVTQEEVGFCKLDIFEILYSEIVKPVRSFGSFGKKEKAPEKPKEITNEVVETAPVVENVTEEPVAVEDNEEMKKLMGFGSFSSTHKSFNHGNEKVSNLRKEEELKKKAMQVGKLNN